MVSACALVPLLITGRGYERRPRGDRRWGCEEFGIAIIIGNTDRLGCVLSYMGKPWLGNSHRTFLWRERVCETATKQFTYDLGFQSVAGDIILCIFDEEPARRYNTLVTENEGERGIREQRIHNGEELTSTTKLWGLQCPSAKGCGHQSIHSMEESRAIPSSWPG